MKLFLAVSFFIASNVHALDFIARFKKIHVSEIKGIRISISTFNELKSKKMLGKIDVQTRVEMSVDSTRNIYKMIFSPENEIIRWEGLGPLCGCDGSATFYSAEISIEKENKLMVEFNKCESGYGTAYISNKSGVYKLIFSARVEKEVEEMFLELIKERNGSVTKIKGCSG